jgi:hypothetical protein
VSLVNSSFGRSNCALRISIADMPTKANWNLSSLVLPEGDPMDQINELKSTAKVIDLSRGEPEVFAEFRRTMQAEAFYSSTGLECDMKWSEDGGQRNPCDTCPAYQARSTETDATAVLCALGRKQNGLLDELAAARATEKLDEAMAAAYEADSAYVDEVVAALG